MCLFLPDWLPTVYEVIIVLTISLLATVATTVILTTRWAVNVAHVTVELYHTSLSSDYFLNGLFICMCLMIHMDNVTRMIDF